MFASIAANANGVTSHVILVISRILMLYLLPSHHASVKTYFNTQKIVRFYYVLRLNPPPEANGRSALRSKKNVILQCHTFSSTDSRVTNNPQKISIKLLLGSNWVYVNELQKNCIRIYLFPRIRPFLNLYLQGRLRMISLLITPCSIL